MVITHNVSSINISNHLNMVSKSKSKSMEKLSSGYKINRAADNAAGLTISEKLRGQIKGLDQASVNAQDGISLIQTAEGGMNEIHSLLQRCRELSVESANGTYTDDDRQLIQNEVSQLIEEVDSISNDTEFNGKNLLAGTYDKEGKLIESESLQNDVQYVTSSGGLTEPYIIGGKTYASGLIDFSNINTASDVAKLVDKGFSYTCCTCDKYYSIKFVNGSPDTSRLNNIDPVMEVDISSLTNGTDIVNKIIETAYGVPGFVFTPTATNTDPVKGTDIPSSATRFVDHYSQLGFNGARLYVYDNRPDKASTIWPVSGSGEFNLTVHGENSEKEKVLPLNFQIGSNARQSLRIDISNMSSKQLGIDKLTVETQKKAEMAISTLDNAIKKVSQGRTVLGAYQNRLEHTIANTDNTSENLQSSESRIRDVDMAKEYTKMSKESILEQVAQSFLSQANQIPNQVLTLLNN
ncbi:MAG TPA: flagellin [Lachnospiraceae bacterium]|nr:flagellin [Lachnospiraceae bacterium]